MARFIKKTLEELKVATIQRFNEQIMPVTESGCILWIGNCLPKGYGHFSMNYKKIYPHRFAYELERGPIPKGMTIDHLCRVRCCVNVNHMEVVTRGENTLRGESVSGINSRKTHCIRGHEFIGDNIITYKTGKACRTCVNAGRRRRAADRRQKQDVMAYEGQG